MKCMLCHTHYYTCVGFRRLLPVIPAPKPKESKVFFAIGMLPIFVTPEKQFVIKLLFCDKGTWLR